MTASLPVVLSGPPPRNGHPTVVVTRLRGCINVGNGRQHRFVVRYVLDGRTRELVEARAPKAAVRRASALVWAREPRAVWLIDSEHSTGEHSTGACLLHATHLRPLARAVDAVQAAFVAWE